jgi:hypothetical protein
MVMSDIPSSQPGGERIVPTPLKETDTFSLSFRDGFTSVIFIDEHSFMTLPERLTLYTLIVSLQPYRVLEVGVCEGGSSRIMIRAMDDINRGHLYSIDPEPKVEHDLVSALAHRMTMKVGYSPQDVAELRELAGDGFDFAFIDGDHTYEAVLRDIRGVLKYLADVAYLAFHDAYYFQVRDAIDQAIKEHPDQLQDCGVICRSSTRDLRYVDEGKVVYWGGVRLVAFSRHGFGLREQLILLEEVARDT